MSHSSMRLKLQAYRRVQIVDHSKQNIVLQKSIKNEET